MTKNLKRKMLATLCMVFATVSCFSVANLMTAAAATTENIATEQQFWMTDGAAVRVKAGESGIRWETNVEKSWYESLSTNGATVEFHTLVTAADNIKTNITELTYDDAEDKSKEVKDLKADVTSVTFKQYDTNDDGEITADDASLFKFYGSIIYDKLTSEYQKKAYAAELIARSYISITTGEGDSANTQIIYATAEDTARSIRAVANACVEDTEAFAKFDEETEQPIITGYLGDKGAEVAYSGEYFEKAVGTGTLAENTYNVAYVGSKKVGTVNGTTLTLTAPLTVGETYNLTLFDDNGNYAKTSDIFYITAALTNSNFATHIAETTTDYCYYLLKEDITASSGASSRAFKGTLDGNGHKMGNLYLSSASGLFKSVEDGSVIKNLVVENVHVGNQGGVFAEQAKGKVAIDNVYVSFKTQDFSVDSGNETYVQINQRYKGLFSKAWEGTEVNVSNSVIYMPEFLSKKHGFVLGQGTATVNITDSTFIGGNGRVYGNYTAVVNKDENTKITDAVTAHKTCKEGWTAQNRAAYESNHPYVEITAENFETQMPKLIHQIAVLTEDITVSDTWNTNTNKAKFFQGVFDGQGYTIDGVNPKSSSGGLFNGVAGSVKNLSVVGELSSVTALIANYAGNAGGNTGGAYFENLYIEITNTNQYGDAAPIACFVGKGGVSVKNVVVNILAGITATPGFFSQKEEGYENTPITALAENCYVIFKDNDTYLNGIMYQDGLSAVWTEHYFVKGVRMFVDYSKTSSETPWEMFDEAYKAGEVTLTEMQKAMLYPSQA